MHGYETRFFAAVVYFMLPFVNHTVCAQAKLSRKGAGITARTLLMFSPPNYNDQEPERARGSLLKL